MSVSRYEYQFDAERVNDTASAIFRSVRDGGTRVLDLGSGPGIVAGALAQFADKQVTCIDANAVDLEVAAERGAERTIHADLGTADWSDHLAGDEFDVIILADILEHLVQPAAVLRTIRSRGLLARRGYLVISIPNAAHISILAALLAGDFPYRPTGLLDATHLRFFTLTSMRRLLEEEGFGLDRIARTTRATEQTELSDVTAAVDPERISALMRDNPESDVYQYVLTAKPLRASAGQLASSELEDLRRRLRKAKRQRTRAVEANTETEERLQRALGRVAALERRMQRLQGRHDALEAQLDATRRSATWRAGRAVVGGPAAVKRALRRTAGR